MKECVCKCDMCGAVLGINYGERYIRGKDIVVIAKAYRKEQPADLCFACWEKIMDTEGELNGKA